jgi:nitrite reductase/ring-hydroxylating ferredoxin subunit
VALWLTETLAGTIGFMWPNLSSGFGSEVVLGTLEEVDAAPAALGTSLRDGAPSYFQAARTFVLLIDPTRGFVPGASADGEGTAINVRTLYQRCPHLGCKPNFCTKNYWFECPCHGSRYDRLGIKAEGFGPALRGLDWFAASVSADGVLTVNTAKISLGPLPVARPPGLIRLSPSGASDGSAPATAHPREDDCRISRSPGDQLEVQRFSAGPVPTVGLIGGARGAGHQAEWWRSDHRLPVVPIIAIFIGTGSMTWA